MDKKFCLGCRNDFYNGNNHLGVELCWSLLGAKRVKRKEVHINQRPPWKQKAQLLPSCFSRPQYVYVEPTTTC